MALRMRMNTMPDSFLPSHRIRAEFAVSMATMYRREVPQYGTLVELVERVNTESLVKRPELAGELERTGEIHRLSSERHGAIRLGTAGELFTMRRLFAVMDMHPVGYYDLSTAGIPVHSTAFRPLSAEALQANPFRIFTSLLRPELVDDVKLRDEARSVLAHRHIFSDRLIELIELFEQQGGLDAARAREFVDEAVQTFRWQHSAAVDSGTYHRFLQAHPVVADIVCFRGPHINHLTPRTLDIDEAQHRMPQHGLTPKAIIEGPPRRDVPILLRQTSFQALNEHIRFPDASSGETEGSHSARFGEIEQRGMALTVKGRQLYDELLGKVRLQIADPVADAEHYYRQLAQTFSAFPDDLNTLHRLGLGYVRYSPGIPDDFPDKDDLDAWVSTGSIELQPMTYEDFLPVSAAGIFRSNLAERKLEALPQSPAQQDFESALGCAVFDEFEYYSSIQHQSLRTCLQTLGLSAERQQAMLKHHHQRDS